MLLLVTLALEDALSRENTMEVHCLMRRRQGLLDDLSEQPLDAEDAAILSTTAEIEKRLIANLKSSTAAIAGELRTRQKRKLAAKAYAAAPSVARPRAAA
jgi:hypothetical protein